MSDTTPTTKLEVDVHTETWPSNPGSPRTDAYHLKVVGWHGNFELSRHTSEGAKPCWSWRMEVDYEAQVSGIKSFDTPMEAVEDMLAVVTQAADQFEQLIKGGLIK